MKTIKKFTSISCCIVFSQQSSAHFILMENFLLLKWKFPTNPRLCHTYNVFFEPIKRQFISDSSVGEKDDVLLVTMGWENKRGVGYRSR